MAIRTLPNYRRLPPCLNRLSWLSALVGLLLLGLPTPPLTAQPIQVTNQAARKQIDIPFEYENHFIIVSVVFNNIFPLRFIFDTGAEYTILAKREITDLLQIDYHKRFTLQGADLRTELYAYLVRDISLSVGAMRQSKRNILVLEDDYFRFEEFSGVQVHGILGADFFRNFVVRINYKKRIISLIDPQAFHQPRHRDVFEMPVQFVRNKPYIQVPVRIAGDTVVNTRLLMDTGASLALLLYTNTHPMLGLPPKVIPSNIGMGIGGFLEGYLGRIANLSIQNHTFHQVITNFQELPDYTDTLATANRNGILGNQLLQQFEILLDYPREQLFLNTDGGLKNRAEPDHSGLVVIATGASLNQFTIFNILPNSPATRVGLHPGDLLKRINGIPASLMSLRDVNAFFHRKPGRTIRLQIERNGVRLKKRLLLESLI